MTTTTTSPYVLSILFDRKLAVSQDRLCWAHNQDEERTKIAATLTAAEVLFKENPDVPRIGRCARALRTLNRL